MRVALRLGELHHVHALARVPVQERAALEHRRELRKRAREQLLHRGRVREARRRLRLAHGRHGAQRDRDVVRDPLYKLGRILPLKISNGALSVISSVQLQYTSGYDATCLNLWEY